MYDARKAARQVSRDLRQQLKIDFRPGQHVMTPEWILEGRLSEALEEAYAAGKSER